MKNFKLFLSIIALSFLLSNCKKEVKPNKTKQEKTTNTTKYSVPQGKHCFISEIKNPIIKGKDTIYEINKLILNCTVKDNKVTGNYNYIPYKEKIIKSTFEGILDNNIVISICNNPNNDRKKEEFIFRIEKDKISILGGEKVKKDDTWYFVDKSKGFYMNELPRINCN